MEDINKNIKTLRKQKKYTQAHIASNLGITTRSYCKIENGETNLTIERLYEISNMLDINIIQLFNGTLVEKENINNNEAENYQTNSISLVKHYQETISLLKDQNELLKKLLYKKD